MAEKVPQSFEVTVTSLSEQRSDKLAVFDHVFCLFIRTRQLVFSAKVVLSSSVVVFCISEQCSKISFWSCIPFFMFKPGNQFFSQGSPVFKVMVVCLATGLRQTGVFWSFVQTRKPASLPRSQLSRSNHSTVISQPHSTFLLSIDDATWFLLFSR